MHVVSSIHDFYLTNFKIKPMTSNFKKYPWLMNLNIMGKMASIHTV